MTLDKRLGQRDLLYSLLFLLPLSFTLRTYFFIFKKRTLPKFFVNSRPWDVQRNSLTPMINGYNWYKANTYCSKDQQKSGRKIDSLAPNWLHISLHLLLVFFLLLGYFFSCSFSTIFSTTQVNHLRPVRWTLVASCLNLAHACNCFVSTRWLLRSMGNESMLSLSLSLSLSLLTEVSLST